MELRDCPSMLDGVAEDEFMSRKEYIVVLPPSFACCVSGPGGSGSGGSLALMGLGSDVVRTGGMKTEVRGSSVLTR